MVDEPVVTYRGGVPGLPGTRANRGQKIDPNNPLVIQYAAYLDARHAAALAAADVDTSSTPAFLGLKEPGGLWEQLGGVDKAGEDVIVGIVDSGIWPENLSFSHRTGTKVTRAKTAN